MCKVTGYTGPVKIRNFVHRGLERFYEDDNARGLPSACLNKLRNILIFLDAIEEGAELRTVPVWKGHLMSGDRKGFWSLHVTRN